MKLPLLYPSDLFFMSIFACFIILPFCPSEPPKTKLNINVDNKTATPLTCALTGVQKAAANHYAVFIHCYWDETEQRMKEKRISLSYPHDNMTS